MSIAPESGTSPLVAAKIRVPEVRALPRKRLLERLGRIWEHRLGLVIAPAGSGKTTLLAQFAATVTDPVAWYRAEGSEGDAAAVLAYLETAFVAALGELSPRPWVTVEDAARALEGWSGGRALLVVDDLHALRGSPAEAVLARLVDYVPPGVAILAGSRSAPGFDVSRLQVAGQLLEIRADDLRFRSWEVERLFHDFYRERYAPEELAELTHRIEGWAAGLQLFHLATRDRRADERRHILAALHTRSRLAREYLAGNVLDQLPGEVRRFLLDTCVLGRLTGPLCDTLLGRSGSAELLEELARTQTFTTPIERDGAYRYHEVLRSHLCAALVDEVGEAEVRRRHVRAAQVLEAAGELHDALLAYCRGEDWQAVGRLLGHEGEQIAHDPGDWLDLLPPAIREHDPWVQLATARRWRAHGRWSEAVAAYRSAEEIAESHGAGEISRRERLALSSWLERPLPAQPGWAGLVRQATIRDPRAVGEQAAAVGGVHGAVSGGLAALLAGDVAHAHSVLRWAAQSEDASPALVAGVRLGAATAALLAGRDEAGTEIDRAVEDAEALAIPWLGRLGRTLLGREAPPARAHHAPPDPWGDGLDALLTALRALHVGEPGPAELPEAARGFATVGATVLEVWCLAAWALDEARRGAPEALADAREAEARARSLAVPGAWVLAQSALAVCLPKRSVTLRRAAEDTAEQCGLRLPALEAPAAGAEADAGASAGGGTPPPATGQPRTPVVALRCFGGLALTIEGEAVDLSSVRPRVRSLLRFLALQEGRAVHREVIAEALWPGAEGDAGMRGLHVAVSSLRRVLHPVEGLGVMREGDAYRLRLPEGALSDVRDFQQALAEGRRADRGGQVDAAVDAYLRAVGIHEGELLPEEGPAEWVVASRDKLRSEAVEAAERLGCLLFDRGDTAGAVLACEQGLKFDRYRDVLWTTLIAGLEAAGAQAAAAHARQRYDEVLAELGLARLPPG
ncbi:MAG TPA: BTAD domain-containing putative transcriptional regulator [Egibacteraceae bacterium]|nr:BTAD domain-containing putative transcriptional regulator [Egibacteraceae bacterium]